MTFSSHASFHYAAMHVITMHHAGQSLCTMPATFLLLSHPLTPACIRHATTTPFLLIGITQWHLNVPIALGRTKASGACRITRAELIVLNSTMLSCAARGNMPPRDTRQATRVSTLSRLMTTLNFQQQEHHHHHRTRWNFQLLDNHCHQRMRQNPGTTGQPGQDDTPKKNNPCETRATPG
jgi:hypothetical protein